MPVQWLTVAKQLRKKTLSQVHYPLVLATTCKPMYTINKQALRLSNKKCIVQALCASTHAQSCPEGERSDYSSSRDHCHLDDSRIAKLDGPLLHLLPEGSNVCIVFETFLKILQLFALDFLDINRDLGAA